MWQRLERICVFFPRYGLLGTLVLWAATAASFAEQEGLSSREHVRSLIKNAASIKYSVPESAVTAYVDDRRLTFPECGTGLNVSFPFSDRSTSELSCELGGWKRYIRITIKSPYSVFTYARSMKAGEPLLRSDLTITQSYRASDTQLKSDQLQRHLGLSLAADKVAGSIVMLSDFRQSDFATKPLKQTPEAVMVWVSKGTVARNTRLRKEDFEFLDGDKLSPRLPHDLVSENFEFTEFEVTKTLMPGDMLRRSILRITPAVKEGEILTLNIRKGPLRLTTKVEALESGMIAENIQVRSLDSDKRLMVRIRDTGVITLID